MTARVQSPDALVTPKFDVLGIDVAATDLDGAVAVLLDGVARQEARLYTARDVHGVMLAQRDPELLAVHTRATLNLPDGMPLVVLGRIDGHNVHRVAGPDFTLAALRGGVASGVRHFLYGGREGVAQTMRDNLQRIIPGVIIVGAEAPADGLDPRALDALGVALIRAAAPDVVWLGLSTPKQEYWMDRHLSELGSVSVVGVGAAFDIHAGHVQRPPVWMQRAGAEWFYRLVNEPKRLWRRYLVLAPQFVGKVAKQRLTVRRMRK